MTASLPHGTDRANTASAVAKLLFEIEAIHFNAEKPYRFTSGWNSPVYVDCRRIISFPQARTAILDFAVETLVREVGIENIDAVAGGETAGIPFAAWIADRLNLPMLYVRKKPKGFGRESQIEGVVPPGRVLLVEDLATDAASKVNFVEALRAADHQVQHALVVFYYGIFARSTETLRALNLSLHALATWHDALAVAKAEQAFDPATLDAVAAFLEAPESWSAAHSGIATPGLPAT